MREEGGKELGTMLLFLFHSGSDYFEDEGPPYKAVGGVSRKREDNF